MLDTLAGVIFVESGRLESRTPAVCSILFRLGTLATLPGIGQSDLNNVGTPRAGGRHDRFYKHVIPLKCELPSDSKIYELLTPCPSSLATRLMPPKLCLPVPTTLDLSSQGYRPVCGGIDVPLRYQIHDSPPS